MAKKRLRRQIVQGIHRAIFSEWIQTGRSRSVRLAVDEQAGHFRIAENCDGASEPFFEHQDFARNPLCTLAEALPRQPRVVANVPKDTGRHDRRVPGRHGVK